MKKILLFLAEGFEFYEASVFFDVLGWNRSMGGRNTEVISCGLTHEVKSAFHHKIIVDRLLSDVTAREIQEEFHALALPGGFKGYGFYRCAYREEVLSLIRNFEVSGKLIASVCVGALPIARSGVLSERNGVTYPLDGGIYTKELMSYGVNVRDELICEDGNIITSQGPGTATDVAFLLLAKLTDIPTSDLVRNAMGFRIKPRQ